MKFSGSILAAAVGIAAPLAASAFSTVYTRGVVRSPAAPVATTTHASSCPCCSFQGFALSMSEVAEDVPAEVEAMDGVASDEEAHNVERPARGSGIHKHHKDDNARTELKDLEIGAEVTAKVKTITSYGAFLDIGAKSDALVHVSRLSDDFVANVEDVVKQGDEISVRIVSVDTDKKQIAVTMRSAEAEAKAADQSGGRPTRRRERPQRSGADQAAQAASINALAEKGFDDEKFVDGEVVSSLDFGAFVRFDTAQFGEGFDGEVDGLVHISALAEGRTASVADVVSIGDKVQIRVRSVDTDAGRISLSMITKEQEEASRPAPRERKQGGGGGNFSAVANSWKDTGAADWKEQMEEFTQPGFTNTAVVVDRR
jgi:predicted RNA-binding protein with RPS1 domain